jgi:hypothetical protein
MAERKATAPVSRSLKRAAGRPAPARNKAPNPRLTEAARAGLITRHNTEPGTAGRKAADAVTYQRRQERHASKGLTARQAVGHPKTTDRLPTFSYLRADGTYVERQGTRAEAKRANRVNWLTRQLLEGRISEKEYARRVGGYAPLANGDRFLADPRAVIALTEDRRSEGEELWYYESGRS